MAISIIQKSILIFGETVQHRSSERPRGDNVTTISVATCTRSAMATNTVRLSPNVFKQIRGPEIVYAAACLAPRHLPLTTLSRFNERISTRVLQRIC